MIKKNFDTYIAYYRPTRAADTFGQVKENFALYQKAFVNVENYSGNEDVISERLVSATQKTIVGHYISTIDTTYRVLMDGVYYAIMDIETMERDRWMRVRLDKIND